MTKSEIWAHCASVGFFGFLSVFPVMAVFVLIYGLAFAPAEMETQVAYLRPFVPAAVYQLLDTRLHDLASNRTSHLTIGLIFSTVVALYMGSRGIKYLIDLVNLACHETPSRSFLRRSALAVALTLAALLILITALSALAAVPLLTAHLPFPHTLERLALWGRWPLLAGVIFCSFLSLYHFAPNRKQAGLRRLAPGAALATAIWLLLSVLFSVYAQHFGNYGATFGALSAGVVLMLWIYYSAFIVAIGAAFNFEIDSQT